MSAKSDRASRLSRVSITKRQRFRQTKWRVQSTIVIYKRRTTGGGWKGDGGGGQGEIHQLDWSKKKKKKASSGLGENPFLRKRLTEVSCKMLNFWIAVKFCLS